MLNILIIKNSFFDFGEPALAEAKKAAPQVDFTVVAEGEETAEMVRKADAIAGWPQREHLVQAENLRWLHLPSAGADGFSDRKLFKRNDFVLTNSSGVFGIPIAEYVFGAILAFNKTLDIYIRDKDIQKWNRIGGRGDIYGSTIGILGLGDIGNEIAQRAQGWGARVIAMKRTPGEKPEYVDRLYGEDGMDEVLAQSDYVILSLPATAKTRGVISEEKLRKMKKNALLVNIGRGALVNQEALIKALREGWIAGAALDVTTPEPLPKDNPLWSMPNVIITPHASAESAGNQARKEKIYFTNLKLFAEGKPLINQVDIEQGY